MAGQQALFPLDDDSVLKHVNAVALMPVAGGKRISYLGRKLFNVLLRKAQDAGEQDEYEARLHEISASARYESNDTATIRRVLKELLNTTVEWQSPARGEVETWDACNLLSGVGTTKDPKSGAVTVRWRYDSKVRQQLLSPDRYARLSLEAITQLSTHAAMALYEICARYVDNPGHKTSRQHWRWWHPVLTGAASDLTKVEYRFFKRDVIHKAVAEVNMWTDLVVEGPIEFKEKDNRTVADIQFLVRLKTESDRTEPVPAPLTKVAPQDLPIIGRAIAAGVKQSEAEGLAQKFGMPALAAAVTELERRLQMPEAKVGRVDKPGGWLRAYLTRVSREGQEVPAQSPNTPQRPSDADVSKHRAAWTDEWLRQRKDGLRRGFEEEIEGRQQELLKEFREELRSTSQSQVLKRLDASGWQHRMVVGAFIAFYGRRALGDEWDKPSPDDIIAIAAELAGKST